MLRRLILLISVASVLAFVGSVSAAERWSTTSYPGDEQFWGNASTWWDNPAPTDQDNTFIDGFQVWVMLDEAGQCAQLRVGDWHNMWSPSEFRIYAGTELVINKDYGTGNFELGVQPYRDWGNPDWGNHGWGIVTMNGGNVTVANVLAVGVQGVGEFYLKGGTIQAESFSMGTPQTDLSQALGPYDFVAAGKDNLMDITGGKLLLAGDITSLDPRVVAYGGAGSLVFVYKADLPGYTTITAIPEPATMVLMGIGGLSLLRNRKRS